MKKLFSFLRSDHTVRANVIMVGGNFVANIGAYLYYLVMGRLMQPGDFGALQSLISLTGVFIIPLVTMGAVIAKFVSTFVGRREPEKIVALYLLVNRASLWIMVVGGLAFLTFADAIANFLHLTERVSVWFLDFGLFFGLLIMLNKATLQGLSRFVQLTVSQFIESYGKLLLGILAVTLGLGVPGAFGAFILVGVISFTYMRWTLSSFIVPPKSAVKLPLRPILSYTLPSFFTNVGVVSLYSTDVVLVRHFFDAYQAGLYAALSVLGKIIFFAAAPVGVAMFPMVSSAQARGESFRRVFLISLAATLLIAGSTSLVYATWPKLALGILIGQQYIPAAPLLPLFSLFLSFATLINLLAFFFLSIHRLLPVYLTALAAVVQAILIWFFHGSLTQVISISLSVTGSLIVILLLYYGYTKGS